GDPGPFAEPWLPEAIAPPAEPQSAALMGGKGRSGATRGWMVEAMRLIMVSLFAVAGWQVASRTGPQRSGRLLVGIVVGSGVGFVLGGALGRRTASAVSEVEREFRRIPAADALAATIGLVVALGLAALLAVPLFHLPPAAAYPTVAFVYLTAGTIGYRVGRTRSEELLALFGVKPRAAGGRAGDVAV